MLENCVTAINATIFLLLKGYTTTKDFEKTYFFNIQTMTLTPGPSLLQPRVCASCSRMRNPASGIYDKIVVAGGVDSDLSPIQSTEILDLTSLVWSAGPDLPLRLYSSVMVEHFDGGVVVVGGADGFSMVRSELYHLPSESDVWQKLNQNLMTGRIYLNVILVHESFVTCYE